VCNYLSHLTAGSKLSDCSIEVVKKFLRPTKPAKLWKVLSLINKYRVVAWMAKLCNIMTYHLELLSKGNDPEWMS